MRLFDPWVGNRYKSEGLDGRRVLILGEAHYGKPEEETSVFTRECVESLARGPNPTKFFTIIAKLLLGVPAGTSLSHADRSEFWDRVAFHNYVQSFPCSESRVRPTPAMWQIAAQCLPEVLMTLRPQFVLVLGRALAARAPSVEPAKRIEIAHPSSFGFPLDHWMNEVQGMLRRVS
jgi:hypothetical protein